MRPPAAANEDNLSGGARTPHFPGKISLSTFQYRSPPRTRARSKPSPTSPVENKSGPSTKRPRDESNSQSSSAAPTSGATSSPYFPAKRRKTAATKTSPSTYSELSLLPDAMGPSLLVMFVGLNPGIKTSHSGHAYAHPSNLFWKLLHSSGLTPTENGVPCKPAEDQSLPARFSLGLTNIVSRPSRNGAELTAREMDAGVPLLHVKAARARAEVVCIVGKSIWESIWRVTHGRRLRKEDNFEYGWQVGVGSGKIGQGQRDVVALGEEHLTPDQRKQSAEAYRGAVIFVAPSTSGLAATVPKLTKEKIWRDLGMWAQDRRLDKTTAAPTTTEGEKGEEKEDEGTTS